MNQITSTCSDALTAITPYDCGANIGNRIELLIIGKDGQTASVVSGTGNTPTVSEFTTAIGITGDAKLIAIRNITNGVREEASSTELTGNDALYGLREVYDKIMSIKGNLKQVTLQMAQVIEEYNQYNAVRVWAITDKGYCLGGKTGYKCAGVGAWTGLKIDGTKSHYSFDYRYNMDLVKDDMAVDLDYLDLDNPAV